LITFVSRLRLFRLPSPLEERALGSPPSSGKGGGGQGTGYKRKLNMAAKQKGEAD